MKLINIHNKKRQIYLFCRDEKGEQIIIIDNNFYPYYYEESPDGKFKSFDGKQLKKLFVIEPKEVRERRTYKSYESDIIYTKRYMIDKITNLEKAPIKYSMLDIEVLTDTYPNPNKADYPISCISFSNSFTKEVKTFYLGDYITEYAMIEAFITEFKKENFDLVLAWNMDGFDYPYLHNRIPDFAKKISPIGQVRYGGENLFYPAGISIIDLLKWDKKITLNKRPQYSLDAVLQEELGRGKKFAKVDFGKLNPEIKLRNAADVADMMKLEEKKKYIAYYDDIRRLAKVEWEDLIWNSRTIDMLLLQEAKKQNVILPMKPSDNEKEDFEGAYREAYSLGAHFGASKYDLSSAYPYAIIDFCLDPSNINDQISDNCIHIEETRFEQNPNALLPTVVKKLIELKNIIGKEKKNTSVDAPEYEDAKIRYNAIKSIVNSAYGVMGNRFFRLYDKRVASATTFLVRDVLHYVKDKIEEKGYKVIYVDTDGIFIDTEENLTDKLNELVQDWARQYHKEKVNTKFGYEGIFEQLILLAKCRYKGWLRLPNGELKVETKGIEAKRKDSTVFMKKFQIELLEKIRQQETKESIIAWIKQQMEEIKNEPLINVSFPCKLAREPEKYKNIPIFLRALNNTENYDRKVGQRFYYTFMEGKDDSKKQMVMAFDEEKNDHIDRTKVDWQTLIKRNIIMKLDTIFTALNWNMMEVGFVEEKKRKRKKKQEV